MAAAVLADLPPGQQGARSKGGGRGGVCLRGGRLSLALARGQDLLSERPHSPDGLGSAAGQVKTDPALIFLLSALQEQVISTLRQQLPPASQTKQLASKLVQGTKPS